MRARVKGIELNYEIDGDGPVCFVLHGGLGLDHTTYRRSLQPLADSLRLIFVDFRNNGGSEHGPLESVTMTQLADDIVGLADHLDLDDFLVLGHSYGGFVAQELAIRHVGRVRALLLVSTRAGGVGRSEDPSRHRVPARPAGLTVLDAVPLPDSKAAARFWRDAAPYFTNTEYVDVLRELMSETLFEGPVRKRGSAIYQTWSSIDRLRHIQAPTLIIVGENDAIAAPADARRIADHLPNSVLVEIDGANHFPWIETPGAFYDTVRRWLYENDIS